MNTMEKYVLTALAALLVGSIYVAWFTSQTTEHPQPFDSAKWGASVLLNTTNDPGCFRGGMALDLIDRKSLSGKTGAEVVALLGAPSRSSTVSWLYPVGQCGFLWGHYDLKVIFGADGKVIHADLEHSD